MIKKIKTGIALAAACAFAASANAINWTADGSSYVSSDVISLNGLTFSNFRVSGDVVANVQQVSVNAMFINGVVNLVIGGPFNAVNGAQTDSQFYYSVSGGPISMIDQS